MTAVCPSGGSSAPSAGLAAHIILTAGTVASFLPNGLSYLVQFLGLGLGIVDLDLPTFCAVDPPADPGLSAADYLSIATAAPDFENPGARDRLRQLVRRYAWYAMCTCTTTGPLDPPTPPTAPTGIPAINPPGVVGTPASPCSVSSYAVAAPADANPIDMVNGVLCDTTGNPTCASLRQPIPIGAVAVQMVYTADASGQTDSNPAHPWFCQLDFFNGATFISTLTVTHPDYGFGLTINNGHHSDIVNLPSGTTHWELRARTGTGGFIWQAGATLSWYCSTAENLAPPPICCTATDSVTQGMLNAILQAVTLLQRQNVPFAYISGTAHHSLTGSGTLAVQGILGVLLNVSIPAGYGVEFGTPDTNFTIGDLRFGTADGYASRVFIDTADQVVFPEGAGVYTVIAWNLSPGVSMTLTELVRES